MARIVELNHLLGKNTNEETEMIWFVYKHEKFEQELT